MRPIAPRRPRSDAAALEAAPCCVAWYGGDGMRAIFMAAAALVVGACDAPSHPVQAAPSGAPSMTLDDVVERILSKPGTMGETEDGTEDYSGTTTGTTKS